MAARHRLIWLAEVPFEGMPHRQPQLARRLTERFDVLYIEPPPPRKLARRGTLQRGSVRVGQVVPLLNARPSPLRQLLRVAPARRLAVRVAIAQLARLTSNGRDASRTIVVCSNVYLAEAAAALRPARMIVDICDDPRYYPGDPPWAHQLLVKAVRGADLVTTSSRWLESEFQAMGAQRVELVPNGIPEEHLEADGARRRQRKGAQPVVGFLGHFGPWVEIELIDLVAQAMPEARLVLAGTVDGGVREPFARLLRHPNIEYRGFVPHMDVPRTIAEFDVGLIPFRNSAYTRAVNPVKLYEYAAQNVPVISTAFSPDILAFRDYVDVCDRSTDFVKAVCKQSALSHHADIRWIARLHTWDALCERLVTLLGESATATRTPPSQSVSG